MPNRCSYCSSRTPPIYHYSQDTSPPPAKKSKDNDQVWIQLSLCCSTCVYRPCIVPMPTVSRHSPLQGTWETKCILDWNDDDIEEWLTAKKCREFLSLELTGGDTLAMCTHPMMRNAGSGQKATHLFNSVGLLIDTHKRVYKDRADEFDFCIATRGKALSFSRKRVISLYGVNFACIARNCIHVGFHTTLLNLMPHLNAHR